MLAKSMYDFRHQLHEQGIILCYSGYVTEPVLMGIGKALKNKMVIDATDTTTMRSVFAIFVEQMQNILRYSAEKEPDAFSEVDLELRYGILAVGLAQDKFFVTCGNKVMKSDVSRLTQRLGELQHMDKNALRALYRQKLREPTEETSKGAGLGFIEIARRSTELIDFDFHDLDETYAFFCLKAFV